jgi:hypothetical protein
VRGRIGEGASRDTRLPSRIPMEITTFHRLKQTLGPNRLLASHLFPRIIRAAPGFSTVFAIARYWHEEENMTQTDCTKPRRPSRAYSTHWTCISAKAQPTSIGERYANSCTFNPSSVAEVGVLFARRITIFDDSAFMQSGDDLRGHQRSPRCRPCLDPW